MRFARHLGRSIFQLHFRSTRQVRNCSGLAMPMSDHRNDMAYHDADTRTEHSDSGVVTKRLRQPFLIGVAGGTASGKTSVCDRIMQILGQREKCAKEEEQDVVELCQDSFYRELTPEESALAVAGDFNFDHPDAFDSNRLLQTIKKLVAGEAVDIPVYNFKTNSPDPLNAIRVKPADVILVEGILIFYFKELRDQFNLKLFVELDADTRLARRVTRDIASRGRTLDTILHQYTTFVKPAFEDYCLPTKKFADVIIPRGAENHVAIKLICQHITQHLIGRNKRTCADTRAIASTIEQGQGDGVETVPEADEPQMNLEGTEAAHSPKAARSL